MCCFSCYCERNGFNILAISSIEQNRQSNELFCCNKWNTLTVFVRMGSLDLVHKPGVT